MADDGCPAQDVGQFRRRERSRGVEKGRRPSASIRTERTDRTAVTHSMSVDVETLAPQTASARPASIARSCERPRTALVLNQTRTMRCSAVAGRARQRWRCRTFHNALSGRRRDKSHHACEGGDADENCADDGERSRQPSEGTPISPKPSDA